MNVSRNVDADGFVVNLDGADFVAVLEPSKLFELLKALELAGRKSGEVDEGVAAAGVHADVLEVAGGDVLAGVADPGDGSAGEVEAVLFEIEDYFDDVGIHDFVNLPDGRAGRSDGYGGVFLKHFYKGVDGGGIGERFVALNVDVDFGVEMGGDFGDALGAAVMVAAGHHGLAIEILDGFEDALVVGGYDDFIDGLCFADLFVDALDHGFSGDLRERLAGKAYGIVTGGDDGDDLVGWILSWHFLADCASRIYGEDAQGR